MAQVSKNGKITFGFKNVNGRAFKLKIINSPRGRFIDSLTLPTLRNQIVTVMNKHGRAAERLVKTPGWAPWLTGQLVSSVRWEGAKRRGFTGLVVGTLSVNVIYGRRLELSPTHPRRLFLQRALAAVQPAFTAELTDKRVLESIVFGTRKAGGTSNPRNFNG